MTRSLRKRYTDPLPASADEVRSALEGEEVLPDLPPPTNRLMPLSAFHKKYQHATGVGQQRLRRWVMTGVLKGHAVRQADPEHRLFGQVFFLIEDTAASQAVLLDPRGEGKSRLQEEKAKAVTSLSDLATELLLPWTSGYHRLSEYVYQRGHAGHRHAEVNYAGWFPLGALYDADVLRAGQLPTLHRHLKRGIAQLLKREGLTAEVIYRPKDAGYLVAPCAVLVRGREYLSVSKGKGGVWYLRWMPLLSPKPLRVAVNQWLLPTLGEQHPANPFL